MNDRRMKWKTLAAERMSRILWKTDLIANLSSHNYEFEDEWIEYLFESYRSKGHEIKKIFDNPENLLSIALNSEFRFKDTINIKEPLNRKEAKFIEVAERRMTNLYKELNYFSRLANHKNYTYDLMDVDYLFEQYENKYFELKQWFPPLKKDRIKNDIDIKFFPSEK